MGELYEGCGFWGIYVCVHVLYVYVYVYFYVYSKYMFVCVCVREFFCVGLHCSGLCEKTEKEGKYT